jgi:hypothetical protein
LFLSVTSILVLLTSIRKGNSRNFWIIGLLFGLTIVTHLTYAVFCLVSIIVLSIFSVKTMNYRQLFGFLIRIFIIAGLCSSWYWIIIVSRYGFNIVLYALNTHGNLGFIGNIFISNFINNLIAAFTSSDLGFMMGIMVVGLFYQLIKKKYLLPIWYVSVLILVGEPLRFLALIGIIASVDLISDLFINGLQKVKNTKLEYVIYLFSFSAIMLCSFSSFQDNIEVNRTVLNDNLIKASQWIIKNTSQDASYLFISNDMHTYHDAGEWLPFLIKRVPVIAPWGAEWLGTYDEQTNQWLKLFNCINPITNVSYRCMSTILTSVNPDLLICKNNPGIYRLCSVLAMESNSTINYQNDDYIILSSRSAITP